MKTYHDSVKIFTGRSEYPARSYSAPQSRWFALLTILLALAATPMKAGAISCWCLMDSQSVSATWGKCGYLGCNSGSPPQVYLMYQDVIDYHISSAAVNGSYHVTVTRQKDNTQAAPLEGGNVCDWWDSPWTDSEIGTAGLTNENENCTDSEDIEYSVTNGITTYTATNYWNGCENDFEANWDITDGTIYDGPTFTQTTCTATTTVWTVDPNTSGYSGTETITLSMPDDDTTLHDDVKIHLPDFLGWGNGGPTASFSFCDGRHFVASGSRMKYRLKVPNSEKNANYLLTWNEVTTTSTTTNIVAQQETITGTGDPVNPAVGSEHLVDMPGPPSDGGLFITIAETMPSVEKVTVGNNPGSGGPGTGGSGGGSGPGQHPIGVQ